MTGEILENHGLRPNYKLKQMIEAYQQNKPQRKQAELSQKSIALAIKLRQEEFDDLLKKKQTQLDLLSQKHEHIKKTVEPLQDKLRRLELENRQLHEKNEKNEKLKSSRNQNNNSNNSNNNNNGNNNNIENIEDKVFTEHLIKISTVQQETEALTKRHAANIINRGIISRNTHKILRSTKSDERIKNLSYQIEVSNQLLTEQLRRAEQETNQAISLTIQDYNAKDQNIQAWLQHAAQLGQYDNASGIASQGETLKKDYAVRIERLKIQLTEKIKSCQQDNQRTTEQIRAELQQAKLAQGGKQDVLNTRTARIAFFTGTIEKDKKLLLDIAEKHSKSAFSLFSYTKQKSDSMINKLKSHKKSASMPRNQPHQAHDTHHLPFRSNRVDWQARQNAKDLKKEKREKKRGMKFLFKQIGR